MNHLKRMGALLGIFIIVIVSFASIPIGIYLILGHDLNSIFDFEEGVVDVLNLGAFLLVLLAACLTINE